MACNASKEYGLTQQALERWYKQGKRETIMHHPKLMVTVGFEPGRFGVHAGITPYVHPVRTHP